VLEEANKIRARKYVSDHRDAVIDKKIPKGYKIIGVRGFKGTSDDYALHIADFIIWQPQAGWLDISPDGQAKRAAAEYERNKQKGLARQWLLAQNAQPKNFIKLNHEKLRTLQVVNKHEKEHQFRQMQIQQKKLNGLFLWR